MSSPALAFSKKSEKIEKKPACVIPGKTKNKQKTAKIRPFLAKTENKFLCGPAGSSLGGL